jgi:hypothetical protein
MPANTRAAGVGGPGQRAEPDADWYARRGCDWYARRVAKQSTRLHLQAQRALLNQGTLKDTADDTKGIAQGNRVNVAEAGFSPRVMTGPGPVTHDFAWIGTKSRG